MTAKQPKVQLELRRGIYAVTIQQPQAAAVLARPGPSAHPSWKTDYRGPLLIHAARREGRRRFDGRAADLAADSEHSALLGVANLVDCVVTERAGGDPDEVGYIWVFANPQTFARPVPYTGRPGLFLVADAVVAGVLAGLTPPAAGSGGLRKPSAEKAAEQPVPETLKRRPEKGE